MIGGALFVSGMQRSGTTLLERLLASQDISILSQPFPLLFVDAKRAFLASLGMTNERYPLGHLFLDARGGAVSLGGFLASWRTSREELKTLFDRMAAYSGQYTRFDRRILDRAFSQISSDDDFAAVVAKLNRFLAPDDRPVRWFGSKETLCEELMPYLLDRGFRCLIIVRDPRDVVASLNHGRGHDFGGELKPTLFNIRNWRKSVAFALATEGRPGLQWCRYEDLVADPVGVLSRVAAGLLPSGVDVDKLTAFHDPDNSSFVQHDGISRASIGRYRHVLPPEVTDVIEATCLPELRLLRYGTSMTTADARDAIADFVEPYTTRPDTVCDAATPENAALEIERLEGLVGGPLDDRRRWFLDERAEARLREAFGG
jgi:hypothetical protein